ncbi:MAG: ABC transporter permease [Ruthenibacterium sp.]
MKISDLLGLSFENLRRRKGRTILTIIGVVVGTCSIVVMVSLGIAMNVGFEEMIAGMGDLRKITVFNWGSNDEQTKLDDDMIKKITEIEHVDVATPMYHAQYLNGKILSGKNGRYQKDVYDIIGIYPEALEKLQYTLLSGHFLEKSGSVKIGPKAKIPVVVGQYIGYSFVDSKKKKNNSRQEGQLDAAGNPIPPFVDVENDKLTFVSQKQDTNSKEITVDFHVVGVMQQDNEKGYETYGGVLMDLNTLKKLEAEYMKANKIKDPTYGTKGYNEVTVLVDDIKNVAAVEEYIKETLGFQTNSMNSMREDMQKQAQSMQMVLGGLGAVSLFVAALSIANTMTMAIYERTREIGVMKVLGCELGKIRVMFLFEAAMIGFVGGVIGIAVSFALSLALNYFGPMLASSGMGNFLPMYGSRISVIPFWLAAVGIIFSTLIGILAGLQPANRAVQISALEAIRHE